MAQPTVEINQLNGQLGREPVNLDGIAALVVTVPTAPTGLALLTEQTIFQLSDAEDLGIDADFDNDNNCLCYIHIKNFYESAGNGAELHIMLVDDAITLDALLLNSNDYAKKLLVDNNGRIRLLAVAANNDAAYVKNTADGFDDKVFAAITNAKALVDAERDVYRYLSVMIEGRGFTGVAADARNLRGSTEFNANRVSVFIGADHNISDNRAAYNDYAAVGLMLGRAAAISVQQNIGRVKTGSVFTGNAGLSSNGLLKTVTETDLDVLNDKGYTFLRQHTGIDGFYFNDSATSAPIDDDYAYLEDGRVMDKASRIARQVYTNELLDDIELNDNGTLSAAVVKYFQSVIQTSIASQMAGEISNVTAFADPSQNVASTDQIKVSIEITRIGKARKIVAEIGFTPPT